MDKTIKSDSKNKKTLAPNKKMEAPFVEQQVKDPYDLSNIPKSELPEAISNLTSNKKSKTKGEGDTENSGVKKYRKEIEELKAIITSSPGWEALVEAIRNGDPD
jgi:hypothetical protein